jgi:hypothetical protein
MQSCSCAKISGDEGCGKPNRTQHHTRRGKSQSTADFSHSHLTHDHLSWESEPYDHLLLSPSRPLMVFVNAAQRRREKVVRMSCYPLRRRYRRCRRQLPGYTR